MTNHRTIDAISRRAALAGLSAGGLGIALASTVRPASAQDAAAMANHPMVGTWNGGRSPADMGSVAHIGADGAFINTGPTINQAADGTLTFSDPAMGAWEPVSERGIHFTFTQRQYDATGAFTGTFTVDGYPVASEDGQTFWDDGTQVVLTFRDPAGTVTQVLGPNLPGAAIGGVKMGAGKPGYDETLARFAAEAAATPTS